MEVRETFAQLCPYNIDDLDIYFAWFFKKKSVALKSVQAVQNGMKIFLKEHYFSFSLAEYENIS